MKVEFHPLTADDFKRGALCFSDSPIRCYTGCYMMGQSEFWQFDITSVTQITVVSDDRVDK